MRTITPMIVAPMGILAAILGMVAFGLNPGLTDAKLAIPLLLMNTEIFHPLIGALTIASIFGLIAGTTTSILLALGSIISNDIYPVFTKKRLDLHEPVEQKKLLRVSRIATILIGFGATIMALTLPSILDTSYISYALRSAAALIIIAGIYWKGKVSNTSAIITLSVSLVATLAWYLLGSPFGVSKVEMALISAALTLFISSRIWRPKS